MSLNYIRKVSTNWYGLVNYSNNRTFFNNIPIPGFIYVQELTRDRFFWFERRIGIGAEALVSGTARLDISAGYAFDREFSEAKDLRKETKYKSTIENNFYVSAAIKMSL